MRELVAQNSTAAPIHHRIMPQPFRRLHCYLCVRRGAESISCQAREIFVAAPHRLWEACPSSAASTLGYGRHGNVGMPGDNAGSRYLWNPGLSSDCHQSGCERSRRSYSGRRYTLWAGELEPHLHHSGRRVAAGLSPIRKGHGDGDERGGIGRGALRSLSGLDRQEIVRRDIAAGRIPDGLCGLLRKPSRVAAKQRYHSFGQAGAARKLRTAHLFTLKPI